MINMMMEDFGPRIEGAISELINEKGFQVPITTACIAANGSAFIFHYRWHDQENPKEGMDVDILVERNPKAGPMPPINILYVDATGERSALVVLREEGRKWMH
jgi:hypothetical protein